MRSGFLWAVFFLLGLSLGLLFYYFKTSNLNKQDWEVRSKAIHAVVQESSKQIITEVLLSEKVTIDKKLGIFLLGDIKYKQASALGSGTIQYGFDWEDVNIEVVRENGVPTVYFHEPDIHILGLNNMDIAYTELSSSWGTEFSTTEITQLNNVLRDSLMSRAESEKYFDLARKNLPRSLEKIQLLIEAGFNAEFKYVPFAREIIIE